MSGNSLRGVEKNWRIEKEETEGNELEKIPSYSVIRQWLGKLGLYELLREKEKRDDWIWIVDLTIELGTEKCLLILGVTGEIVQEKLEKINGCLGHKEVEVLGIEIMKSTKGEKVELVLNRIGEKVGVPRQIISDKGSDLYKGIKLYQEKHQEIIHSHDITHQMALLLKKELEAEEEYEKFAKKCCQTRQKIQQTEIGYLMPPQQRSKSRYFNLDELLKWGNNIIRYLDNRGGKPEKGEENHQKLLSKLEWVKEYRESLRMWEEMIDMTRNIETRIKQEGLSNKLVKEFEENYQVKIETEKTQRFSEKVQQVLNQEISGIKKDEIRIFSSDIIESLFGKYKLFSEKSPLKEIRRMILTIPLATLEITQDLIKQALSNIKNSDVTDWERNNFGQSQLSKRKIAFNFSAID